MLSDDDPTEVDVSNVDVSSVDITELDIAEAATEPPPGSACPTCGAAVEPGWRHCGVCGAALAEAPRRERPRRPNSVIWATIAVLFFSGLSLFAAEHRLQHRTAQLHETRQSLHDTRTLLAAVRTELGERVKERDTLKSELDKTKGSLADAQHSVQSQSQQLETLKACLSAIEDVGNALDRGDQRAARDAVNRANDSCSQAEAFL